MQHCVESEREFDDSAFLPTQLLRLLGKLEVDEDGLCNIQTRTQ